MVNKGYHLTRLVSITRLAVLSEKLTGSQYTEPVKSRVPSAWFLWKNKDFLVTRERQEPMGTARAQPCIQTALVLFYYII